MTKHKREWIDYMTRMVGPQEGLAKACEDMLSNMYDSAYQQGIKDHVTKEVQRN